jgi:hypothetical protein
VRCGVTTAPRLGWLIASEYLQLEEHACTIIREVILQKAAALSRIVLLASRLRAFFDAGSRMQGKYIKRIAGYARVSLLLPE